MRRRKSFSNPFENGIDASGFAGGCIMRSLKYLVLLAALALPATYSQAQVSIGVQFGAPPVFEYGYYDYSPYACAPYGYCGPEWFADGYFICAGPLYHYYYLHPELLVGFGAWRRFDHDHGC